MGSGTIRAEEDGDDVRRGDEIRQWGGRRRWRPVRSSRSAWLEEAGGEETMGRRRRCWRVAPGRSGEDGFNPGGVGASRRRRSSPIPSGSGERESGGASGGVPRVFPPRGDKAGVDRPAGPGGLAWPVSWAAWPSWSGGLFILFLFSFVFYFCIFFYYFFSI